MHEIGRFAIQRDDGVWYAGEGRGGAPDWSKDRARSLVFSCYVTAVEARKRLEDAGFRVRLFGLAVV